MTSEHRAVAPRALRPFASAQFRILALAVTMSLLGAGVWLVAVVWQVIELGGGPADLSLVATGASLGLVARGAVRRGGGRPDPAEADPGRDRGAKAVAVGAGGGAGPHRHGGDLAPGRRVAGARHRGRLLLPGLLRPAAVGAAAGAAAGGQRDRGDAAADGDERGRSGAGQRRDRGGLTGPGHGRWSPGAQLLAVVGLLVFRTTPLRGASWRAPAHPRARRADRPGRRLPLHGAGRRGCSAPCCSPPCWCC